MTTVQQKGLPRWSKWLIYPSIVGVAAALILSQLPRGPLSYRPDAHRPRPAGAGAGL